MTRLPNPVPPKSWNLCVCGEHGVMLLGDPQPTVCPCCELGVEARPADYGGGYLTDVEFRNPITLPTFLALVPLMRTYLADKGQGPLWVACASWPYDVPLPAGYGETERWINVVGYRWHALIKWVVSEHEARRTVEVLTERGYGKK